MNIEDTNWDCVVVGGGAAGLTAALTLGRARRRTLVIDAGRQSNLAATGIGGLLGHDHRPPADLYARGRRELAAYATVRVLDGEVAAARSSGGPDRGTGHRSSGGPDRGTGHRSSGGPDRGTGHRSSGGPDRGTGHRTNGDTNGGSTGSTNGAPRFTLTTDAGQDLNTRRVLLATGMDYRYPDIPGLAELWGDTVFHCPFCHGWEVRGRPLAVLGGGPAGVHRAILLRAWSDDVTLLPSGEPLEDEQLNALTAARVTVDERPVSHVHHEHAKLTAVEFTDGGTRPLGGLLVAVTLHQRGTLAAQLGARSAAPHPMSDETVEVKLDVVV